MSFVELVVLQGNSFCNLNCAYCDLSVESRRTTSVMEFELIEKLFEELFGCGRVAPQMTVVWHSGEPLTLPPSYYEKAFQVILRLRDQIAGDGVGIRFKIQTNGVLIDDDWCSFFERYKEFLDVGVSCDGPAELHDRYRRNWNGRPSHAQTVRGMDLLQQRDIKYKIIAVVTKETLLDPKFFFDFFLERRAFLSGFHFNVLAEAQWGVSPLSYSVADRAAYYSFYRQLLSLSQDAAGVGAEFEILNFSEGLARIITAKDPNSPTIFREASAPLKSLSVDARGNLTTFYAGLGADILQNLYGDGKGLSIGNILETPLEEMIKSAKLQRITEDFEISARRCEESCEYFSVCPGGYETTKMLTLGTFDASETTECVIHVKAFMDALLDDIGDHLASSETRAFAAS